jgi:hypothetical protein
MSACVATEKGSGWGQRRDGADEESMQKEDAGLDSADATRHERSQLPAAAELERKRQEEQKEAVDEERMEKEDAVSDSVSARKRDSIIAAEIEQKRQEEKQNEQKEKEMEIKTKEDGAKRKKYIDSLENVYNDMFENIRIRNNLPIGALARNILKRYFDSLYTSCNNVLSYAHVVPANGSCSHQLVQGKECSFVIVDSLLTRADIENGVVWQGLAGYKPKIYRIKYSCGGDNSFGKWENREKGEDHNAYGNRIESAEFPMMFFQYKNKRWIRISMSENACNISLELAQKRLAFGPLITGNNLFDSDIRKIRCSDLERAIKEDDSLWEVGDR